MLQRFEFVKVCLGRQRLCWKSQLFLYFVNKIYLPHRQPKLKMLGVQCNVTYAMLHNYAKRDSRLTTYGGIVLQRFEFVKVCMRRQRLCWKSQLFLYFVNKIYLPCCRVVFFVVCQLRRPI